MQFSCRAPACLAKYPGLLKKCELRWYRYLWERVCEQWPGSGEAPGRVSLALLCQEAEGAQHVCAATQDSPTQWAGLTPQLKETPPQLPSNQGLETLALQRLQPALLLEWCNSLMRCWKFSFTTSFLPCQLVWDKSKPSFGDNREESSKHFSFLAIKAALGLQLQGCLNHCEAKR